MINHNTQETLVLDLSITVFREYREHLMPERRGRRHADDAETSAIFLNPTL